MTETTKCELVKLGDDAETHEQVKEQINRAFIMNVESGYATEAFRNTADLLQELIVIRERHGVPNDGKCYKCDGTKCDT